ncbi:MAG: TetR family transcriptional regulator [Bacteroidetes bacterium]|nr:TetR family transcriptional regulator [Bacteroidota bacterium]
MPKQKVSIDFILKESLKLFRKKSYHNTSIADIVEACGLLKAVFTIILQVKRR